MSPSSANAGHNGTGQQGNQGQNSQDQSKGAQQQRAEPATAADDGGGSSPLVPILIAIAVLAAISIGAVMLRQRHRRGAPVKTVSPKAS